MRQNRSLSVLAILLVVIGALMIMENYHIISGISKLWPCLVTILGIGFVLLFFERLKNDPVLIWIGTFLFLISLFFFYLNYTSWTRMTRLWSVFLGIMGLSFLSVHLFSPIKKMFLYLALSFFALFIAFYLIFGVSLTLWPTSLIIFGTSLLLINHYKLKK